MTNDRDFGERSNFPFSLLFGHEDMVKNSSLITQGDSAAPGVYGTGPVVQLASYDAPAPVFSNASAAEGASVAALNDSFLVLEDAVSTQIGNLLDDNGEGPDTAPAGKEVFVTAVNGVAFDGDVTFETADGAQITVDSDGNITVDPAGAYEFLAEGEQIIETFTYTLTGADIGFDPGTFEAVVDISAITDETGRVIFGANPDDFFGISIAAAGDVNNDGFADIIIGGYRGGSDFEGRAYIVYGGAQADGALQVSDGSFGTNGEGGFAFAGIQSQQLMGQAVGGGGDFNGDGISDFLIASPRFDTSGSNNAGSVDVIFGGQGSDNVATSGFTIFGTGVNTYAGITTANAGDVNNDGIDDILVGAWPADPGGRLEAGEVYVIFGSQGDQDNVTVSDLNGQNGFVVEGVDQGDRAGTSIASAGDFNGDGITDFIVGATHTSSGELEKAGSAYVIFGSDSGASSLNLSNADFRLDGANEGDYLGRSVSSAGDLNGDGIDDIAIGAYNVSNGESNGVGAVYVVFGSQGISGSLSSDALNGTNGFAIFGTDIEGQAGVSVSSAGDVNADGIDDLLIGAHVEGEENQGAAYVVFGREGGFGSELNLDDLDGANGFKISGAPGESYLGWSVAGVGDMNGDGIDDIAVSAFGVGDFTGSTIIIYGRGVPLDGESTGTVTVTFQGENDLPEGFDDTFSIAEDGTRVDLEETFLANDTDVDATDVLTVASVNGQEITGTDITVTTSLGSTLVVFLDGTFDYIPASSLQVLNDDETAEDTFTYTTTDGLAETTDITVTLIITGISGGPDAVDDFYELFEDDVSLSTVFSGTVNVLDNDSTDEQADLFITAVNGVEGDVGQSITLESGAVIILNADGSFDYQNGDGAEALGDGEELIDTIEYFVSDGVAISAATITITVTGQNDPVAGVDDDFSIGEDDSGLSGTANVLDNDVDVDQSAVLLVSAFGGDSLDLGSLSIEGGFGTATIFEDGTFEYVPGESTQGLALGETADDTFEYTVTDGLTTDTATITVTVTGENDAPEALDQIIGGSASVQASFGANNASGGGLDLVFSSGGADTTAGAFIFGLADIDGDGLPDSPASSSPLDSDVSAYTRGIAVGDIDGDGDVDTVLMDNSNGVLVFTNVGDTDGDGDADFTVSNVTQSGFSGSDVAIGDLNGDGFLDLVTHFGGQTHEFINLGDVNGNGLADDFSERIISGPNNTGTSSYNLEVADINGDGRADIIAPGWSQGPLTILYNLGDVDGDGFLDYDIQEIADGTDDFALGVDTGDIDGDGDVDLVLARWSENNEAIMINDGDTDGDGRLNFTVIELPTGGNTLEVKIVDLDGDGDLDVVGSEFSGNISLMINQGDTDGDGVVNFDVHFTTGPAGSYGIAVQDSDGDGDIDIVVASNSSPSLLVNQGDTDGDGVPNFILEALTGVPLSWDVENLDGVAGIFEDGPNAVRGYDAFDIDSDDDTASLTYTILSQTAEGSITDNGNGTFTFSPGSDFQDLGRNDFRDVSFTYQATDQHGATSAVATVTISVQGTNDGPQAVDDTAFAFSEFPGMQITELNSGDLTFVLLGLQGGAVYGTISYDDVNGDDQITLSEVTNFEAFYTGDDQLGIPEIILDLDGVSYFVHNLTDNVGGDAAQNLTGFEWTEGNAVVQYGSAFFGVPTGANTFGSVTVNGIIDETTQEAQFFTADNVLKNDTDIDVNDMLSVTSVQGQAINVGELITLQSGALFLLNADGSYVYDANGAFDGLGGGELATETITYAVSDGEAADEGQLVISIIGVDGNGATSAVDDFHLTNPLLDVAANVLDNDDQNFTAVFSINGDDMALGQEFLLASGSTVTLNADGSFTYSPGQGFSGLSSGDVIYDSFSYRLDDGSLETGDAPVETVTLYDEMSEDGFQAVYGSNRGEQAGYDVTAVGDINGDGIDDYAVSAISADDGESIEQGKVYVVFGALGEVPTARNLNQLDGTDGFSILGLSSDDNLGTSMSAAGDVNNDGIDDLIIGTNGGVAYVIYGRDTTQQGVSFAATEDLAGLDGTNGFEISSNNTYAGVGFGETVSGGGDYNGDGIDDVLIGSKGDDGAVGYGNGRVYVVLGTNGDRGVGSVSVQSEVMASRAFAISGEGYSFGNSLSHAGDVNGDGIDDIIVGAYAAELTGPQTFIIFGDSSLVGTTFDASEVDGTDGFIFGDYYAGSSLGLAVSGLGDVNGDGIDDIIIGSPDSTNNLGVSSGVAYVIFGRNVSEAGDFLATVTPDDLDGAKGFTLHGEGGTSATGTEVSWIGDLNGDGINEIGISTGDSSGGLSYIIFGQDGGFVSDLNAFAINGDNGAILDFENGSTFVTGLGDINGDGFGDLALSDSTGALDGFNYQGDGVVYLGFGDELIGRDPATGQVLIEIRQIQEAAAAQTTNAADDFTGGLEGDIVDGLMGDDTLNGMGGDDVLIGNGGNDLLIGGDGNDLLIGDSQSPTTLSSVSSSEAGKVDKTQFVDPGTASSGNPWVAFDASSAGKTPFVDPGTAVSGNPWVAFSFGKDDIPEVILNGFDLRLFVRDHLPEIGIESISELDAFLTGPASFDPVYEQLDDLDVVIFNGFDQGYATPTLDVPLAGVSGDFTSAKGIIGPQPADEPYVEPIDPLIEFIA